MSWILINENDIETLPKEGIDVLISDGDNYDVAYYLMSSEYVWMKVDLEKDDAFVFKGFTPTKWKQLK
jgi:hypothetical protein